MKVKLCGKIYTIDKETIESGLQGIVPAAGGKYFIDVAGVTFPIRQVLAAALGIPAIALSSNHCYQILAKVGFAIKDGGEA